MKLNQQDEYFFVCYDEVIKTFKPFILQKLLTSEYMEKYKDIIDYSRIINKSYDDLFRLCVAAGERNIIKELQLSDIDSDTIYAELLSEFNTVASESPVLSMGRAFEMLLNQSLVKKIYIYRKKIDENIVRDLSILYQGDARVKILSGDFDKALELVPEKITMFTLNDITLVNNIIKANRIKDTSVLIANVGYNYTVEGESVKLKVDNIDELSKTHSFATGLFSIENRIKF